MKPLFVVLTLSLLSCSSPSTKDDSLSLKLSPIGFEPSLEWETTLPGKISDLSVAASSGEVAVVLVSDPTRTSNVRDPELRIFNSRGKSIGSRVLSNQVKSLAFHPTGSFIVLNLYGGKLEAIEPNGKVKWTLEKFCQPVFVQSKILCFMDDEGEGRTAFVLISESGKILTSYESPREVLSLAVAIDESHFAIGFTGGAVHVFSSDGKPIFKKKFEGEILDLAIGSGPKPRVALLTLLRSVGKSSGQHLVFVDLAKPEDMIQAKTTLLTEFATKVSFFHDNRTLVLYGNGPQGQRVLLWDFEKRSEVTRMTQDRFADLSVTPRVNGAGAIVGLETVIADSPKPKESRLLDINPAGELRWMLSIDTEDGGYLFERTSHENALFLATDEAKLKSYSLKKIERETSVSR